MLVVVIVSKVLLLVASQVGASLPHDRAERESRSPDPQILFPTLTLVINSPENYNTGLTHLGVFVLVDAEYCLVEEKTAWEWQLLETVNMEPTGHSINVYT